MAKTKISEFSATPGNNTDIDGINIAEGCAPSGINDAIRELMAQLKDFQTGAAGDSFNGPVGTTTAAAGAFTTLSASGAVTLSGGTANGVPYLNGSKVLTTGSALTFDGSKLTVKGGNAGQLVLDNSNEQYVQQLFQRNATANTGADFLLDGSGNTFSYRGLAANMPFVWSLSTTAGNPSEQMRLTSTGLGIGTSSPSAKLTVSGSGFGTGGQIQIIRTDTSSNFALAGAAGGGFQIADVTAGGATRVVLDSSGNLGIGTSSLSNGVRTVIQGSQTGGAPQASGTTQTFGLLRLQGTSFTSVLDFGTNGGNYNWIQATDSSNLATNYSLVLNPNGGNVGIGTSSPANKLHVEGNVTLTDYGNIGAKNNNAGISLTGGSTTNNGGQINLRGGSFSGNANGIEFVGGGTERARIDTSGNLLVATTSAGARFRVGATNGLATSRFDGFGTGSFSVCQFANDNGVVGSINTSGTSTAYNTSSDYRLKHDIAPMTGALAKVAALKPVTYKWNADDSEGEGFIAHELAEVCPQAVTGEKDAVDADGNPVYQGIDTSFLVATLTAAIQEQQAIINQLTARIEALEQA